MAAVAVVTTGYTAVLYQNANGEEPERYYARILAYMDLQDAMEGGYRMDTQENTVTMTAGLPGDGCFSSTISGNIFRFYSAAGEERSVFTPEGPEGKTALFSAAYYLAGEPSNPEDETVVELGGSRKGTFLYRKKEVLPVGAFVYDSPEELDFSEGKKITDWLLSNRLAGADAKETYEDAALGTNSCRITLKLDRKGYALFSIPADYGWEATVNGKKAQIQEKNGLILIQNIKFNTTFANLEALLKGRVISENEEVVQANKLKESIDIKATSVQQTVLNLSGGNQQKVVLAKWIFANPRLMILDEPTRGIDVGAKYEIYSLMNEMVSQGMSIIMISSELLEVIGMSDRIYVMCEGKITGEVSGADATEHNIMQLATDTEVV